MLTSVLSTGWGSEICIPFGSAAGPLFISGEVSSKSQLFSNLADYQSLREYLTIQISKWELSLQCGCNPGVSILIMFSWRFIRIIICSLTILTTILSSAKCCLLEPLHWSVERMQGVVRDNLEDSEMGKTDDWTGVLSGAPFWVTSPFQGLWATAHLCNNANEPYPEKH